MDANLLMWALLGAMCVAVVLLLVLLLRKPANGLADAQARADRLEADLSRLRGDQAAAAAEVARLGERNQTIARVERERDEARNALHEALQAAASASAQAHAQEGALQSAGHRIDAQRQQLDEAHERVRLLEARLAQASAHLEHAQKGQQEMQAFVGDAKARLSEAFAELAGKAFDERSQRAAQQSRGDLETLLKPFSERLETFRNRIDTLYQDEAKERRELAGAVNALKGLNEHMASSADALTRALKGSAKVRGDWGELMLESVLRGSGLEEGVHYDRQKRSLTDEGQALQPDIVVRLPDDRRVVIDSKVNLLAWQEAMNADSPDDQMGALRKHAAALRLHVRDLGERNYPKAIGESALDVTLAFVPIEGALSAALGADSGLQDYAFERRVALASPNTLMAVLRVVERLWTRDKIQKQAIEISEAGGKVLDALQGFIAEFDAVGRKLSDAQDAFSASRNRLSESSQAVIPRARRLVELGARGKKALTEELKPMASFDLLPPDG